MNQAYRSLIDKMHKCEFYYSTSNTGMRQYGAHVTLMPKSHCQESTPERA